MRALERPSICSGNFWQKTDMSNPIMKPIYGAITQGDIFSCAIAEDYVECVVYGLVITARCDAVRDNKTSKFNYLPVVSFDDWIHRDGKKILLYRIKMELEGKVSSQIKNAEFSPSILKYESLERVISTLFGGDLNKKNKKIKENLEAVNAELRLLDSVSESRDSRSFLEFVDRYPQLRDRLVSQLVRQDVSGYYFIPDVEPSGSNGGCVVLLREVRHIPRILAKRIARGLSQSDYIDLCQTDESMRRHLSMNTDDLSMPVGRISSPFIEHVMQVFTDLFGRIGLPDPNPSYMASLWEKQPSVREAVK